MTRKAEKIARMVGKQTRDFRDGFATVAPLAHDSDADIKAALGMAQRRVGPLAVQVLELHYASSLQHEHAIRRAWDRYLHNNAKEQGMKREHGRIVVSRIAAALTIRSFAGAKLSDRDIEEWAWIVRASQQVMDEAIAACETWLRDMCSHAEQKFLEAIGSIRERDHAEDMEVES